MSDTVSFFLNLLLKGGVALVAANEIRGLVLAGPVLYGIYESGGTLMAIWVGFCSLAGIALSVIGPVIVANKVRKSGALSLRRAAPSDTGLNSTPSMRLRIR